MNLEMLREKKRDFVVNFKCNGNKYMKKRNIKKNKKATRSEVKRWDKKN